jgi:hypothetical protein
MNAQRDPQMGDLPEKLAAPARRALVQAGYTTLEQVAEHNEAELLQLHGMGPKAMDQLRRALADNSWSFAAAEE